MLHVVLAVGWWRHMVKQKDARSWTIADLLDLEVFVCADEDTLEQDGEGPLVKRDRQLYQQILKGLEEDEELPGEQDLLRRWLCARRKLVRFGKERLTLPSRLWIEGMRSASIIVPGLGLLSGATLAFALLSYSGQAPVNVFVFLGLLVGLPLLTLVLQALLALLGLVRGGGLASSLILRLGSRWLFERILQLKNRIRDQVAAEQRLWLQGALGRFMARRALYGELLVWPPFLLLQGFGAAFSCGALAATLLKVVFTDVAFGWQSTLQVSAAGVHGLASWLALPWSWFETGGVPTLAQVEGSRMVLKEGIYHLASQNLASWWLFCALALAVYGLLPRLVLLVLGHLLLRRRLATFKPRGQVYVRLLQRMQSVQVTTAPEVGPKGPAAPAPIAQAILPARERRRPGAMEDVAPLTLVLIPDELFDAVPLADLEAGLSRFMELAEIRWLRYGEVDGGSVALAGDEDLAAVGQVVVVQEAWQPPIREGLAALTDLRRRLKPAVPVTVLLLGKPVAGPLMAPDGKEVALWRRRLDGLADPMLEGRPWRQ